MSTTYRAVWHAMACPGGWLPWELMQTPENTTPAEAHMVARSVRWVCPADLVAVRPPDGSQPVWPVAMADHYDLPPYAAEPQPPARLAAGPNPITKRESP